MMSSKFDDAERGSTPLETIGKRLRDHRKRSGMTLARAAEASGLSPAFISLLENGKSDASVGRLTQLATAYGMRASDLLREGEESAADDRRVMPQLGRYDSPQEGVTYCLFHDEDGILPVHVEIKPRGGWFEHSIHPGAETIYCLSGNVEVAAGDEIFQVGPGDRLRIPSLVRHRLRNIGQECAELFAMVADPTFEVRNGRLRNGSASRQ
ncbi:cupin domain-containing protein [Saccharopolyspora sp. WRP15-2]|uniref:Cupin domain-containing protein n=1 Tax=Saccharopolyspora oryzae TaxID=2997343 RepID=A0ABT4UWR3_9PSEU|nr:cupin domain-containing protein [Saccharopolyspora oryzae]MDA3626157.1 cupin domain-containing protein [Saccharopolyspora oryzae]